MASIQLTKVVAPSVWGWLGDRSGQRVRLVRLGALAGAACFAGVFAEPGFTGLLLVMLAFTFFWNAILPLYEVITLGVLGSQRDRYGRVRLWGSVGFIGAVALIGALLERLPVQLLPWLLLPVFAGIAVSTFFLPPDPGKPRPGVSLASLGSILSQRPVLVFFLMNLLLQVSHGPYYTFFSIHLAQHGYGKLETGLLWSLGVLAEIALFLIMHGFLRRFSIRSIALVALGLTALRWVLIAELAGGLPVLLLAQLLHAASYGALHAISVQYIQTCFGQEHHGQGQALYSGLSFGAGGAAGAWMSGLLVESAGTGAAFWGGALAALVAMAAAWWGFRTPAKTG